MIRPADIARLLRAPALAGRRAGRARLAAVRTVWHDTQAGDLAEAGLALSEQRGAWRLERLRPNGIADWLPATPAPLLAEASTLEGLAAGLPGRKIPPGLLPVAAFTGRRRSIALAGEPPAGCSILEGTLRGVVADEPACRLTLSGSAPAMAALAAELSGQVPLAIPRAGLAEGAVALAQGRVPAPRHLGAPEIPAGLTVADAMVLVVGHLADVILHWAPLAPAGLSPEPVHQMRVAVRRLRSALAIFRRAATGPALADLAPQLRDLARRLGEARDWDVFLAGTGAEMHRAFPAERRIAALIAAASRRRIAAYASLRAFLASDPWRRLELELALLPTVRPWLDNPAPAQAETLDTAVHDYAARSLQRRLKLLGGAGDDLEALAPEALHDLRKQAKRLRYAAEFFAGLFSGKAAKKFLGRLEDVQEALGAVNDAAVAGTLLASLAGGADRAFATGAVQGYMAARAGKSAVRAGRAWKKFLRQPAFWE